MESLKLDLFVKEDESWFPIQGKEFRFKGKFQYITFYKTAEETMIWTNSPKKLLAFTIPTFSLN